MSPPTIFIPIQEYLLNLKRKKNKKKRVKRTVFWGHWGILVRKCTRTGKDFEEISTCYTKMHIV